MSEPLVTLDYSEAFKLAQRAVADKGEDYVYDTYCGHCVNFEETGAPSCIVGHILSYKGMTLAALRSFQEQRAEVELNYNTSGIYTLADVGAVKLTRKAYEFLRRLQTKQDIGAPWGIALRLAAERAEQYEGQIGNCDEFE